METSHDTAESAAIPQFPVPLGWFTFGHHIDQPGLRLELSAAEGEDGLPLWERPATPPGEESSQ